MRVHYQLLRGAFLVLIIQAAVMFVQAQCTQKVAMLPVAPELLGFRLGMTKDEIKLLVPQVVFGRPDAFGVSKTTINPYFDPKIDKSRFESVRSISLDLLDDRLTSLWIGFDETFKAHEIDEFISVISESLKVPNAWTNWKGRGEQIKCADFQLIVSKIAGGPSLRILDLTADDLIAERRQQKLELDSAAETESSEERSSELIGDKRAKVYYLESCQAAKEIPENYKIIFKTAGEAEKAGFKLAKDCPKP